jgi:hypothetical protein
MATERMLVWEGISLLDGTTPIVVLATGVPKGGKGRSSANSKTGDMIQIAILIRDVNPVEVLSRGTDTAICGTCPHRSKASGGSGACYVGVWKGPNSTWKSHVAKGSVPFDVERFRGQKVRFGSYGDPAAVPFHVWESIASVASGWTGYTHQWRTADQRFSRYLMASADSAEEGREARKLGYRNFIVRPAGSEKPKGAVTCPASAEAGKKLQCADCLMCSGTGSSQPRDITIIAHGATAKNFTSLPLTVV